MRMGAFAYLMKPVQIEELILKIHEAVSGLTEPPAAG
jgi:response regulator of citrate/malate metabolism